MHSDTLRLDLLEIVNYRGFPGCEVRLDRDLTVFVAENGQGKTAILDAIATALGPVVRELSDQKEMLKIETTDIRQVMDASGVMTPAVPTEIHARGVIDGHPLGWTVRRATAGPRGQTLVKHLTDLKKTVTGLRSRLEGYADNKRDLPPPLPLIAYYGTGRLWAEQRLTKERRRRDITPLGQLAGYQDCLASESTFKSFVDWYGSRWNDTRDPRTAAADPRTHPMKQLAAVRQAVRVVLEPTGWTTIDWDPPIKGPEGFDVGAGYMVAEHPTHGRLPLSRLSDGVRNMIALVADVACRCVRLNPSFGEDAAQRTPGILLVDEIDMHLHPRWQQVVVKLVRAAFPQLQIVMTTHSPQVLSTVDSDSIRIISSETPGEFREPPFQTKGADSAYALMTVMGVDPVPDVSEWHDLRAYHSLIESGAWDTPPAHALRLKLDDHFGPTHPLLLDCQRLIRFQAFKRERKASAEHTGGDP